MLDPNRINMSIEARSWLNTILSDAEPEIQDTLNYLELYRSSSYRVICNLARVAFGQLLKVKGQILLRHTLSEISQHTD